MAASAALHPSDKTLQAYGLGKLDDALSDAVIAHVQSCSDCQRQVAGLSADSFLGRLRDAEGSPKPEVSSGSQPGGEQTGRSRPVSASPTSAAILPPELLDHRDYEVVCELGRGGMGVVYLARNKLMGRMEVLKVVGSHVIGRPGIVDRFLREIRSAAKLHHPNIVTAHSAIRLGDHLVFAMEFIDGDDLAKVVKAKGPLSVADASSFTHQAALGLQHAHERGMVHRDIKPANLIVTHDSENALVKVLDFGLAKVTSERRCDSGLTDEGQILGTPDFMAPEQIRDSQSADIRADIYSLGCTFYYLLTGGPPFRGDHLWDLLQAHLSMEADPLNLLRSDVPVELAALVAKMMAKDPARRFETPGAVAQALTPFFKQRNVTLRTEPSTFFQPGSPMEQRQTARGMGSWVRPPWRPLPILVTAGALGLVPLGIIAVIHTRNSGVATSTEKGNTSTTVDETAGNRGGLPTGGGEAEDSRANRPPGEAESIGPMKKNPKPSPSELQKLATSERDGDLARDPGAVAGSGPRAGSAGSSGGVTPTPSGTAANTPVRNSTVSTVAASISDVQLLKTEGLVKSGNFFVLSEEEKVLQGLFNMRPFMAQLESKYNAWAAIIQNEYEFQQLGDYKIQITRELNDFRVAYNNIPAGTPQEGSAKQQAVQQFRVYDSELRQVDSSLELHRKRLVGEAGKRSAEDEFKKARENFMKAKGRLWPDVESLMKRYDELKSNDSVLNALKAVSAQTQARIKIGPSDDLSKKAKQVIAYERTYSPETAPQPKIVSRTKRLDKKKTQDKKVSPGTGNAVDRP